MVNAFGIVGDDDKEINEENETELVV